MEVEDGGLDINTLILIRVVIVGCLELWKFELGVGRVEGLILDGRFVEALGLTMATLLLSSLGRRRVFACES